MSRFCGVLRPTGGQLRSVKRQHESIQLKDGRQILAREELLDWEYLIGVANNEDSRCRMAVRPVQRNWAGG